MRKATWGKYRLENATWGKYTSVQQCDLGYRLKKTTPMRVEECDLEDGLGGVTLSTG